MKKNDIFSLNQIYLLESTKTNQPYITEDGACLFFLHEVDAQIKAQNITDVRVSTPRFYTIDVISKLCYTIGASKMVLFVKGKEEEFKLRESQLKCAFYNHQLASVVMQLKQTGLTKYLYDLALCEYIVPAKVQKNEDEIHIKYGIVRHITNKEEILYLAFTNLDEFAIWSTEVGEWSPLIVSYKRLRSICGNSGFFLNPRGNRLIITCNLLKMIDEHIIKTTAKNT